MERASIDLAVVLPAEVDGDDACARRLAEVVGGSRGVSEAHVVTEDATAWLCVHYDDSLTSVSRIRELAGTAGAQLGARYGHAVWPLPGVVHARRARRLTADLLGVPGVLDAEVSAAGMARLEWDRTVTDGDELAQSVAALGLPRPGGAVSRSVEQAEAHEHDHDHGGIFGERTETVFAMLAGALVALGQVLARTTSVSDGVVEGLYVAAFVVAGWFTAREAWENIRHRRFEIDALMLVAATGAAVLGEWFEGALLLVLFALGHALEGYAMGRARRAIEALAELAPTTANVRRGTEIVEVPVAELQVGEDVVVRPNERFPVDGFVVVGTTSVNQAPVTGESTPVDKQPVSDPTVAAARPDAVGPESRIFAGSLNGAGAVDVQVSRLAGDSTLARVARLVAEAETEVAPTQRLTERFERIFVPVVIAGAVAVAVLGPLITDLTWETGFYRSMAVLVAASPCALAIATPSAVLAGIARAARSRVLVKGGAALEQLGGLQAMAFDKTGTLTEGRPRITDVVPVTGVDETELLTIAVAVERLSDHPLARAINDDGAARLNGAPTPMARDLTAIMGRGVAATVDGAMVHIGNRELFDEIPGTPLPAELAGVVDRLQADGRTIMVVRAADRYLGVIGLMDTPRADAPAVMERLRESGIVDIVMLSGDATPVAAAVARQVGVDRGVGDLMPDDKVTQIKSLRAQHGSIAMVGDGVNDAPALASATVGIAMGAAGSDVALETADVALMADELHTIPFVIRLSRRTRLVIRQNLYLSLAVVAALVPLTIVGLEIGPAVVAHEGSTLIVVANALRLLAFDPRTRMVS
jgi:Cd2+/Zn2+-exporting ATPase